MGQLPTKNPKWLVRCGWCGYQWTSHTTEVTIRKIIEGKCPACQFEGLDAVEVKDG